MAGFDPPGRLVTLTDVAREAGVGESTVSRVLRNHGSYSKRAGERVAEAVARLGYVPNRLAGSLAGGGAGTGSGLVGVVIPSLANIVFPDLLRGLTAALDGTGMQSVVGVSEYDPDREEALVAALLSWRPEALLLTGLEHSPGTVSLARAAGVRVVEMIDTDGEGIDGWSASRTGRRGRRAPGISWPGATGGSAISASIRGATGGAASGSRPSKRCWRRPACPSWGGRSGRAVLGRHGPGGVRGAAGAPPGPRRGVFRQRRHGARRLVRLPRGGARRAERIALFGFNGLDFTEAMPQPLSTIRTPRLAIGRAAAGCLTGDGPARIDLGFDLIEGATA